MAATVPPFTEDIDMASLYELTAARLELQHKLESMNFDDETIECTLDGDSTEICAKIEDYGFVLRNRHSFADAMTAEIDRMVARRDAEEHRLAAIEKRLLDAMVACGIKKVEGVAFTISVKQNPAKVEVFSDNLVPAEYMSKEPPPKPFVPNPDKKAIAAAIKGGSDVPGCKLVHGNRLEIK
jgi:hypothetical protein